jgi:hypothetical protein
VSEFVCKGALLVHIGEFSVLSFGADLLEREPLHGHHKSAFKNFCWTISMNNVGFRSQFDLQPDVVRR